jgi:hypothetical protein
MLELSTHLKTQHSSEIVETIKQRDQDMSNNTDSYYRTHLRVPPTKVITAEEKAMLSVEISINKLRQLDYMEGSLVDIKASIKDLWNEIKQAAQVYGDANRVYT